MISLKIHIRLALVLGIFFLIALVLSYFVVIDISQTTGNLELQPEFVRICFINIVSYLIYTLFILTKVLKRDKIVATQQESQY